MDNTTKPFLNHIKKKYLKEMKEHRLKHCPYPDSCAPVSYHTDKLGAGNCCGLIYKSQNLDCIRQCLFWRKTSNPRKLEYFEHFMTPDEALGQAHSLTLTAREALLSNREMEQYYKDLDNARKNGDIHPSDVNK